jgi:hypothetical protein
MDIPLSERQDLYATNQLPPMKTYNSIAHILSLACAGLIAVCVANQAGAATENSGHLAIYRVANFGSDLGLVVSIDGKDAGTFSEGNNYSGDLPAGEHTIIVRVDPNRTDAQPAKITLNVVAGQTYSYTAGWSGEDMALTKNP